MGRAGDVVEAWSECWLGMAERRVFQVIGCCMEAESLLMQ